VFIRLVTIGQDVIWKYTILLNTELCSRVPTASIEQVQHTNLNNPCVISLEVFDSFNSLLLLLDDYAKARNKLARAEITSNLESEVDGATERPERKKRYANFVCVSSILRK